jgi:hypothetical protein
VASPHSAALTGSLTVRTEQAASTRPQVLWLTLGLTEGTAAPDTYVYVPSEVVDVPASWQALPFPANATSLLGIYVRAANRRDQYTLRVTRTTAGVQTFGPLRGTQVLEFDPEDPATAIEIQGELTVEYLGLAET